MHAFELVDNDVSRRTGSRSRDATGPARRKDRWDKAEIVLRPVGGLLTAIAIATIGFLGSNYFEKKQATETNLRLYTELMNKREEAENTLRTDMFGKIFEAFLSPSGAASGTEDELEQLNDEILSIDLIARNFHEFLDIKPLFRNVLLNTVRMERRLKRASYGSPSDSPDAEKTIRRLSRKKEHLVNIAGRIIDKQLEVLEEAGQVMTLRIPFERVCTDKSIRTYASNDYCYKPGTQKTARLALPRTRDGARGGAPVRAFTLYVERAYPDWRMARVKVTAIEQDVAREEYPDVDTKTFWVGAFDFPMVDNTYLSPDERYTVVVDGLDEDAMVIKLVYFPASYAGLREKSYYHQKVVQQLIDRSELFSSAIVE